MWVMLSAQRVRSTEPHLLECLTQVPRESTRLSEAHEATEGALTVCGRCVEQHPRHRTSGGVWLACVDPFPDARGGIAALQGELTHQGMGERVEQHVPNAWKPSLCVGNFPDMAPLPVG